MSDRAFPTLVRLEVRRGLPSVLRTLPTAVTALAVMAVFGWLTPQRAAWVLFVLSGMALAPVLAILRDKLDGSLEFLVSLPVDRGTLAAARLVGTIPFAVGGAVCLTAGLWLVSFEALPDALSPYLILETGVVSTGIMTIGTALATGVGLRLRARHFANLMLVGFVGVVASGAVIGHLVPGGLATMLGVMARPWFPRVAAAVLGLGAVGAVWLSYALTRSAFERFRPERDKIAP